MNKNVIGIILSSIADVKKKSQQMKDAATPTGRQVVLLYGVLTIMPLLRGMNVTVVF